MRLFWQKGRKIWSTERFKTSAILNARFREIIPKGCRLNEYHPVSTLCQWHRHNECRPNGYHPTGTPSQRRRHKGCRLNGYHPVGTRLKVIAPTAVAPKDNVSAPWSLKYRFSSFTFLQELCLSNFCLPSSVTFILTPLLFK